ncbi:hypothetical protein AXE65_12455 [Ventosimonas gracilis]|uniref:Conjugal transfer protein TraM n=1 Tax=Ventosimonas gracilis TaxID=1680762 RepID=A0A139SVT0_9GAMM|nr:hypothetical protein [Ventosimonas gracilis]KXU38683.1 hypothetical protein AXE65_12455 [Ventosimonas gracilis]
MDIDLDALAAEIGRRHGLKLDKDDPIMIVVTAVAMLEQEMFRHKQKLMAEVVSEVEAFMTRNNEYISTIVNQMLGEAKNQAQAIINKTLIESKKDLQEAITQTVQTRTANIRAQLEPSIERARQAAYMSLMAGGVAVLAAMIVLWASLFA